MLLDPERWALAYRLDDLLPVLSTELTEQLSAETHACTLELATRRPYRRARRGWRGSCSCARELADELRPLGLRAAVAGTHPFAQGEDTEVSGGARYQALYDKMRELARREPTFALHVHVGVPDPELAILAADRMRAHLPLILAPVGNSPYWRGRDSGMASFRTPLFQGFPRSGVPRRFGSYARLRRGSRHHAARRDLPRAHLHLVGRARAAAPWHRRGPDSRRADDRRCHGRR